MEELILVPNDHGKESSERQNFRSMLRTYPAIAKIGSIDEKIEYVFGYFCSVRCPGDIILKSYELARSMRNRDVTVIGGFQSPMEKEFLEIYVRGTGQTIICPARGIKNLRIPSVWKIPMAEGRMMVLSFFDDTIRRTTKALAIRRNKCIAAISDIMLVAHAGEGSKTEHLCKNALDQGKPVFALDSPDNHHLIELGARPLNPENLEILLSMTRG